ncbi:MAG: hypothetical protein J5710_06430 [Treponema sp.]|nr:hypothetical protein [Treponema sp.]
MKKIVIRKNIVLTVLSGAVLCLMLAACKNFLNAGKVKEEIEHSIYVNNHECPVATVEEPAFSDSGVAKNKAIIVSFSMAVDPETFYNSYSIEDSSGNSLISNFMEPQWSNENKLVTIAADEKNLIDMRGKKTMDIYFKLSKGCQTADKLPIKTAINHKYRINDELDETPPILSVDSFAERPEISFQGNIISEALKLKEGAVTTENEETIINTNHINSKISFYIEGNDFGGGDVNGHIICKRIKDVNGNDVSAKEAAKSFIVDGFKQVQGSDEKGAEYLLDLSGSEYKDGLYEIKVYVQDTTGTDSEECQLYYVIRDTTFEYTISSRMFTVCSQYRNDLTPGFDNPPNYVKRDLIDPNGNDYYYDRTEWIDPNDTSKVRYDYQSESAKIDDRWYWGPETAEDFANYYTDYLKKIPTKDIINADNNVVAFQMLANDLFYKSKLTNEEYRNNEFQYSYYLSWGKKIGELNEPVRITGRWDSETNLIVYDLPKAFVDYYDVNKNSDIILCANIADVAGNTISLINLCPKDIEFYSYKVEDSTNGKKKVKLNFNESAKIDYSTYFPLPDKSIDIRYKIFYAKHGQTNLKRNTSMPLERDLWSNETDSSLIDNLEPNTIYDVYIQPIYNFDSKTNGIWNGNVYGHLTEVTVNTALIGDGNLPKPVIQKIEKESAGINTGLFTVTATITEESYNAIKQYETDTGKKVKYVPAFNPIKEFDKDKNLVDRNWIFYESTEIKADRTITFTVKNPLRAPFAKGEAWAMPKENWGNPNEMTTAEKWETLWWDAPVVDGNPWGDYTYFQAVEACKTVYHYPNVDSKIKIVVTDDANNFNESDEWNEQFCEDDDNIPPKMSPDVSRHDGRLSYDGHSFEFENLVFENEGHLCEYFNYYYEPYNPSIGDNLPEATSAIESLPGGITAFNSSTWFDNNRGADYNLNINIPVYGLEDGQYMFYAKISDTYGNYIYVTLGKVNIGTFKNKLKVELVRTPGEDASNPEDDQRHFLSTLKLESDELNFERNMINLQEFADYKDDYTGEEVEKWGDFYGGLNALQECLVENVDGNTILRNYNPEQCPDTNKTHPFNDKDVFFIDDWDDENLIQYSSGHNGYPQELPKSLYHGHWFRLTLQSFNENYIIPGVREDGVDKIYGRPYHYHYNADKDTYELWTRDVYGYVEGETKYDVCTEETVSNTVYFFTPGEWWDNGVYKIDDFKDFKASFFPSSAAATSNYPFLINVIAAGRDLGSDSDEWERRGKLIATHIYDPNFGEPNKEDYRVKIADSEGKEPGDEGYIDTYEEIDDSAGRSPGSEGYVTTYKYDEKKYQYELSKYLNRRPDIKPFSKEVAQQDMASSKEKGFVYYVAVVHFADGSSAVSDTYTMYGY